MADPDGEQAEFAILIRSDLKGQGLGYAMLEKLIRYCRARGVHEIVGQLRSALDIQLREGSIDFRT